MGRRRLGQRVKDGPSGCGGGGGGSGCGFSIT